MDGNGNGNCDLYSVSASGKSCEIHLRNDDDDDGEDKKDDKYNDKNENTKGQGTIMKNIEIPYLNLSDTNGNSGNLRKSVKIVVIEEHHGKCWEIVKILDNHGKL